MEDDRREADREGGTEAWNLAEAVAMGVADERRVEEVVQNQAVRTGEAGSDGMGEEEVVVQVGEVVQAEALTKVAVEEQSLVTEEVVSRS